MSVVDQLRKALTNFPKTTPDAEELQRLQRFLAEMRAAGVAKTREYDLPPLDTIGRSAGRVSTQGGLSSPICTPPTTIDEDAD